MARAKKVVDEITYRVIVEKGRLVPAFASDAEKLDSWRDGSKLIATLKRDGTNPLVDKFHALIGDAIKGGNTPWTNAESAKSAIKWALGMIDVTRSVDKNGKVGPLIPQELSLNAFTDAQLSEFIEQEIALLYRLTGVDWEKEYRDRMAAEPEFVPDYPPPESSDNPTAPHAVSDEGRSAAQDSTPMTAGAAATQSHAKATEDNVSTTALEGGAEPGVASRPAAGRTADGAGVLKSDASVTNTDPAEATNPAMVPEADPGSAGDPASTSAAGATSSSGEEKAAGVGDGAVSPPAVRYFYHAESESLVTTADGTEAGEGAQEISAEEFAEIERKQDEAIAAAKAEKKAADKTKPRTKGDVAGADAAWLLGLARRLVAATEPKSGRQYIHLLAAAAQDAKDHYPKGGIGEKTKEVAKQIYNLCFDISLGTVPMDEKMIATLAGCKVADLKTPEAKS